MSALGGLIAFLVLVTLFVTYVTGYTRGQRNEKTKTPSSPQPTCPCGHTIGEHKEMKSCQSEIRRPHYDSIGSRNGHKWVRCQCTKYWGPKPYEDMFHQGTFFPPEDTA